MLGLDDLQDPSSVLLLEYHFPLNLSKFIIGAASKSWNSQKRYQEVILKHEVTQATVLGMRIGLF